MTEEGPSEKSKDWFLWEVIMKTLKVLVLVGVLSILAYFCLQVGFRFEFTSDPSGCGVGAGGKVILPNPQYRVQEQSLHESEEYRRHNEF